MHWVLGEVDQTLNQIFQIVSWLVVPVMQSAGTEVVSISVNNVFCRNC